MSLATLHGLVDRVERLERQVERVTRPEDRRLSIKQAARQAGYSYSHYRKIRHRHGFRPGARYVEAKVFYAALERERGVRR